MWSPKSLTHMQTSPLEVVRSQRGHDIRVLTSLPAGKMVPIAAIPLLREDGLRSCAVRLSFEMSETVEVLMNAVNVNVKAYLVSKLCTGYETNRFAGMDDLNRSYKKEAPYGGGAVVPFNVEEVMPSYGGNEILKYMGKHVKETQPYNMEYVHAYNAIWNFRARQRSPDIGERSMSVKTLANAFWQHEQFSHILPDFDQALMDGEVTLNVADQNLAVKDNPALGPQFQTATTAAGPIRVAPDKSVQRAVAPSGTEILKLAADSGMFVQLQNMGITVSLSNLEMARKTQSFALLREQYNGIDDDYLIDLLMDGLTIPEQAYKQPILLGEGSTVFGMSKRYASDAGNLTESVVNGLTGVDLRIRCPRVPMGGVVMIVAEITPEQLFERQMDPYLYIRDPDQYPAYLRDTLDPEKVEIVQNAYVDTSHGMPTGTFGYAPLNHRWNHNGPCIGGKFFRPAANAPFDEDRQRIWAVETLNPTLSTDFYVCTNMHLKPFVVTTGDPFEVVARGAAVIDGNTVFGGRLKGLGPNNESDWDKVDEKVDDSRLPTHTT